MIDLTDETLVAYVDGELSAETCAQVESLIAENIVAQTKVKDMRETAELLRLAFAEPEMKTNVVTIKTRPKSSILQRHSLTGKVATAAAAVLVVGVVSLAKGEDERAHFMTDVAAYHSVYSKETEHLAEVPASRKSHIEEWLGSRINRALTVPDLAGEGWAFEGGRLLAEGDKVIAELLYTAPGRQPIALCITHSDQPESSPAQYNPGYGMKAAAWDAGGYLYIIVGGINEAELEMLTEKVRRHFHNA
jgi:anti-sigma factor RsiW